MYRWGIFKKMWGWGIMVSGVYWRWGIVGVGYYSRWGIIAGGVL